MRIAPIIDRIAEQCPQFLLVGGAAQFEQATQGLTTIPAAFVLPASEKAGENPFMSQIVEQEVISEFSVLLAVRNLADGHGAAATDALEDAREAVFSALLAWQPGDTYYGCEYVSGDLLAFDNGVLWWADVFTTGTLMRSN